MGKQHSSANDKPSRRPSGGRPGADRTERSYGNRPSAGGYGNRSERPERGGRGDNSREGYSAARPAFGQGGGRPGGAGSSRPGGYGSDTRRSFGGGERPSGKGGDTRRSFGGSERPSGGSFREERGERPAAGPRPSYGDRPAYNERRDDRPRRAKGERPSFDREERPKKAIWQGQPVRYEGKPTVPRGQPGERSRKFIKKDPTAPAGENTPSTNPASEQARPAYQGRDERRAWQERGADKPAGYGNREGGNRENSFGGDRADRRPAGSREGGGSYGREERRPTGDRREGGYDKPRTTGSYERRPTGGADSRREGGYDKPRSAGERPSAGGSFRERRDAMRDQVRGGRASGTSYGRGEGTGQAPDYKNLKHYEDDKNRGNKRRRDEEDFGTEEMRLNRYIANAGICSRREADALIAAGEIRVNGEVVTEMGYKVQPSDTVQYGKTNLNREKLVYVLLNKPKDFITTTDDPEGRKTVMDLVANASKERIFPVGRLDRNTTGLLLFTNDGEVAQKLSHPSHKNKKIYQVELSKPLTAEHLREISTGVELEDGKAEVDDVAVVAGNPHFVGVELHIGRNRIVRRIFEHLGYEVVALDRVQYAGITKKDLPRGKWRFLSEQEVIRLKYFM
ncbi:pseudouridine synthase [Hymenobacter sp. RP-2-7]|uniref:Pseudouridine synthase n=1 Tax=Hymenobacter polaris TaxID=2682546 RepID=A0A7Y0FNS3_9BACT|nr:pseudouridine synthase [Hymenobacter polaris]NML66886.1 pseudouridine synthase [Hymenobacter polaris]